MVRNGKIRKMAKAAYMALGLGAVAVGTMWGIDRVSAQPDDTALRDCDVDVVRFVEDHRVWFETKEGHGGLLYYMVVDGKTNENHDWPAERTDDGYGFTIPYTAGHAGTVHDYLVQVSRFGEESAFCEAVGSFRVKGEAS